jgi:hypothetical protein
MAAKIDRLRMRASAQDGTTVTLVPVDGEKTVPDIASDISQIVVTMGARDTKFFDITNRRYRVTIEKM